jgi:hypothetical protein
MICSKCKQDKPDKAYPHNYGRRNGSTCLECRRKKYKTRTEVARSKVHAVTSPKKKCSRCIDIGISSGLTRDEAKAKAAPVLEGNYFFCYDHFEAASKLPEEYHGW